MAHPRQKFVNWLSGRDPSQVEQIVENLHLISDVAFTEVQSLIDKLAACEDPKSAADAARVEVEKRPVKTQNASGRSLK